MTDISESGTFELQISNPGAGVGAFQFTLIFSPLLDVETTTVSIETSLTGVEINPSAFFVFFDGDIPASDQATVITFELAPLPDNIAELSACIQNPLFVSELSAVLPVSVICSEEFSFITPTPTPAPAPINLFDVQVIIWTEPVMENGVFSVFLLIVDDTVAVSGFQFDIISPEPLEALELELGDSGVAFENSFFVSENNGSVIGFTVLERKFLDASASYLIFFILCKTKEKKQADTHFFLPLPKLAF